MADKRITGPIQVLVIGFDKPDFGGQILAELRRRRKRGVIRLVDLLFVEKAPEGNISSSMHMTDLSEAERLRLGAWPVASSAWRWPGSPAPKRVPSSVPSAWPSETTA